MKIGIDQEHNISCWRCPNCGGKGYWPDHVVSLHDKFCSNCGIGLEWDDYTYEVDFYDKFRERMGY